jgi:hypothetical protein
MAFYVSMHIGILDIMGVSSAEERFILAVRKCSRFGS